MLPASFAFLRARPDVVLPMQLDVSAPRFISFGFQALARLKPGVTLAQANDDVARMISLLPPAFARLELRPNVRPLADDVTGDVVTFLWILLAAVGVVLLIACGNVANLFLVRAEGRQQELAMRTALGASYGRIARGLLSESVVLAVAGGAVGVLFAWAAVQLLRAIAPAQLPRINDIVIDANVLLFTLGVSMLSGVLFGLFAVVRFGRPGMTAIKEGGRAASDAPARHRTRNALVVGQVALALTLLIVAGLMVRTFVAMRGVDPGFTRPEEVQTFVLSIPPAVVADNVQAAGAHERIAEQLARVPGVTSVGLSTSITMDGEDNGNTIDVEGAPLRDGEMPPLRRFKSFGPGYFETMGIRMVAGRSITWNEIREQRPVVVISQALAREVLAGAVSGRRQAHPRAAAERALARDRRRRRRRTRRRVEQAGDRDCVLADAERELPVADDGVYRAIVAGGDAGLPGRARTGGLVGRPQPAAGRRADAGGDPGTVDGADVAGAGHARHRCGRRAADRNGRDLRRHLLRRDAADA